MNEIEDKPMFETRSGGGILRSELLLENYQYWADHAVTPRQRMKNLRVYWELADKTEKRRIESSLQNPV